jgi:hypothetical protein
VAEISKPSEKHLEKSSVKTTVTIRSCRTAALPFVILSALLAPIDVAMLAKPAEAAQGDCGQPLSTGSGPSASDALFVLRAAIGLDTCDACVCDVDATGTVTAGDALLVLKRAVGENIAMACVQCGVALYGVGYLPIGDGTLYRIDDYASSPTAVAIGGGNLSLAGDIAIDPTTGLGYAIQTTGSLVRVDLSTGAVVAAVAGAGANPNALTFSDDGTLYSWGGRPQSPGMDTNLYVLDKINGGGQAVLDTGYIAAGDLAYDGETGLLFGSASTGELIRIDLGAMSVTSIGFMIAAPHLYNVLGLEIDPLDGTMYALVGGTFSDAATLYTVDKTTAEITLVGDIDGAHGVFGGWGLAFGPAN